MSDICEQARRQLMGLYAVGAFCRVSFYLQDGCILMGCKRNPERAGTLVYVITSQ